MNIVNRMSLCMFIFFVNVLPVREVFHYRLFVSYLIFVSVCVSSNSTRDSPQVLLDQMT